MTVQTVAGIVFTDVAAYVRVEQNRVTDSVTVLAEATNGDINVNALKTDDAYNFKLRNGYNKGDSTTYESTNITGENISLNANAITIDASSAAC